MRVLISSPGMDTGGAERVVCLLANGLERSGVEVGLVAPEGAMDEQVSSGVRRFRCDRPGRSVSRVLRVTFQMAKVLRVYEPDIVHSQNVVNTVCVWLARFMARSSSKVVASYHGTAPAESRLSAALLKVADRVVCVSEDLRRTLDGTGFLKTSSITVVRNGVEEPSLSAGLTRKDFIDELLPCDPPAHFELVVCVGRLVEQKNHRRFVEAASIVSVRRPHAYFVVVGEGPLASELEQCVESFALEDRLSLVGLRRDAREIIALAEVLVFSSDWEGLSIAALEALAGGTVVVTTGTSGMTEVLAGGGGVVTEFSADALANAIINYLEDEEERAAASLKGRNNYQSNFSVSSMVTSYLDVYSSVGER